MTCKELHDRILEEFLEPDTGILNILPEQAVRALLDTPEAPAPEGLLRVCRENAVTDDFEERDSAACVSQGCTCTESCEQKPEDIARCAAPTQQKQKAANPRLSLTEMLRWAAAEAERRNRGQ